ncbi:MAG: hypothetical protein J6J31_03935 [Thermoguttaceae bacterium]|nr:hypothetical protein [Thermoguttaceae bacterium]
MAKIHWYAKVLSLVGFWCGLLVLMGTIWGEDGILGDPLSSKALRIEFIPEMDEIRIGEKWRAQVELNRREESVFQESWDKNFSLIQRAVTPDAVREISRWSREEMENFRYVTLPKPAQTRWETVRHDSRKTLFLRCARLDPLPSSPQMKRELTAYALFDSRTGNVVWVGITIQSRLLPEKETKNRWWFF